MVQTVKQATGIVVPSQKEFVRFASLTPGILIRTDEDHTRLPWLPGAEDHRKRYNPEYLENNRAAFTIVQNNAIFLGATGLDFESLQWIQKNTGILNGFPPTDIEVTDNGLEIRVNEGSVKPELWFDPSNKIPADSGYEQYIQKEAGYDREIFNAALKERVKEFGFIEVLDRGNIPPMALSNCIVYEKKDELPAYVIFSYGESAIYFIEDNPFKRDDYEKLYKSLSEGIMKEYHRLTSGKKNIKYESSHHEDFAYIFFSPNNAIVVNKETALKASLELLPRSIRDGITISISAGDSINDKHLITHEIEIDKRFIPNYSIVTGKSSITDEGWFKTHPRIYWKPDEPGNIGPLILEIDSAHRKS